MNGNTRKIFSILAVVIVIAGILGILSFIFPSAMSVVFSILWLFLLAAVVVFFVLGILVILGLKSDVGRILDILLEGSLTLIDFIEFVKKLYQRFIQLLQEFVLFITPVLAYVFGAFIYVALIFLYKTVGKTSDVTILTIVLTVGLISVVGILSKPQLAPPDMTLILNKISQRAQRSFTDVLEIIIFIFFLTMDLENIFFLPADLRIPLTAKIFDYDLMVRAFHMSSAVKITVNIVIAAISIEVLRNILRIVTVAIDHYRSEYDLNLSRAVNIKGAVRKSFGDAKDDLVKFITYTTVLMAVFFLFPRLKILTVAIASATSLVLDLLISERLYARRGNDLLSRLLNKIFKL